MRIKTLPLRYGFLPLPATRIIFLHPVLHLPEAAARIPDRKVGDPPPQDPIDQLNHPSNGLGLIAPEASLEPPKQCGALLHARGIVRPPLARARPHPAEGKAQTSTTLPFRKTDDTTFRCVQCDVEECQCLAESFHDRPQQPIMLRVGIDQDHDVIGKARVLQVRVQAATRNRFGPLQPSVDLGEVQVAEQRCEYIALNDVLLARGLQDQFEHRQHVRIADPLGHLRQQDIMSDVVEVSGEVNIQDACFVLDDRLGHALDRFMGGAPWGTTCVAGTLYEAQPPYTGL